jgi:hypothetical protein
MTGDEDWKRCLTKNVKAKTSMVEYFKKSRKRKFKRDIMSTKFKSPLQCYSGANGQKEANDYNPNHVAKREMDLLYQSIAMAPCQLFVL